MNQKYSKEHLEELALGIIATVDYDISKDYENEIEEEGECYLVDEVAS